MASLVNRFRYIAPAFKSSAAVKMATRALPSVYARGFSNASQDPNPLKEYLEKGHKMGLLLKDKSASMSEDMRNSLREAYIAYSMEASRKISEMGDNGRKTADNLLKDITNQVPEQLKSTEAAQQEAEKLLNESKERIASLTKELKDRGADAVAGASQASSSVMGTVVDTVKQGAGVVGETVKQGAEVVGDTVKQGAGAVGDTVKSTTTDMYERAKKLFNP